MNHPHKHHFVGYAATITSIVVLTCSLIGLQADAQSTANESEIYTWRTDPAWYQSKAEWALYDATRVIYGKPRSYEATIFTNKQKMDPDTSTKSSNATKSEAIEVFKHNVSEMIETENYTYRFLTTSFIRTDTLEPYKIVVSTQEDCGTTYKQFVFAGGDRGRMEAVSFSYFPEGGEKRDEYNMPGISTNLRFHDDLTLTLRDFPFEARTLPEPRKKLIPDQTDTHATPTRFAEARVDYIDRETIDVPYGTVDTHHLRVTHEKMGGVTESHYWFAADIENLRHVLVKYEGPYGVRYKLKKLAWWAYWNEPRPE